jgi:hypothetical protein
MLLIAIVAYALLSFSGLIVTWNLGPVTTSIAPAAVLTCSCPAVRGVCARRFPIGAIGRPMRARKSTPINGILVLEVDLRRLVIASAFSNPRRGRQASH